MESMALRVHGVSSSSSIISKSPFNFGLQRSQIPGLSKNLDGRRVGGRGLRVLASSNVPPVKRNPNGEVVMVDPLEAKRLAVKQMQEIKAREKFEKQRRIEAINGAWAMIGLTAGLVIEGHTGSSIPNQVVGYVNTILSQLDIEAPSSSQLDAYWSKVVSFFNR